MAGVQTGNGEHGVLRESYRHTRIAAGTATTVVKAASGTLHAIVINTSGAASNTITVYDNTAGSGTVVALIDGTSVPKTLLYDADMLTGITIVSATGTGADLTILWT